jgi:hypothetical protein
LRHKIENADEKDILVLSSEKEEILSSADMKMRFRNLLTGVKFETKKITDLMDNENSSTWETGEINFKARISKPLMTTLRLVKSDETRTHTGMKINEEFSGTLELNSRLHKNLEAKALYTLKDKDGESAGKDTSTALQMKTGRVRNVSADAKYELRRSEALVGDVTGAALVGAGINYNPNDRVFLRAFYEKRGTDGDIEEDRLEYGIESSFKARESLTIKGELKKSELYNPDDSGESYSARAAYLEAVYKF